MFQKTILSEIFCLLNDRQDTNKMMENYFTEYNSFLSLVEKKKRIFFFENNKRNWFTNKKIFKKGPKQAQSNEKVSRNGKLNSIEKKSTDY